MAGIPLDVGERSSNERACGLYRSARSKGRREMIGVIYHGCAQRVSSIRVLAAESCDLSRYVITIR